MRAELGARSPSSRRSTRVSADERASTVGQTSGTSGAPRARRRSRRAIGPRSVVVRSSVAIVVHDDDAVAREADVELEAVGAERQPLSNAAIVFSGASARAAAVREDERTRDAKKGCRTGGQSSSDRIRSWRSPFRRSASCAAAAAPTRAPVKQEIRDNLVRKLQAGEPLFPGIIGYDETVIPQLVNAILSRHNFILLGLRGQAKSRILRGLVDLLDEQIPVVPGCEIHDDPLAPICGACRARVAAEGDTLPIAWLPREDALRREAGDARRDDRRHGRRHRSDQGGAGGPQPGRRADDALRAAAAGQPRHLRDQRAARSRRQDSGRPVQHPAGRRRPD